MGSPGDERPVPKEAQQGGSTDPKGLLLEARLVAKENAYTLDLDGKTPEQFRKLLHVNRIGRRGLALSGGLKKGTQRTQLNSPCVTRCRD